MIACAGWVALAIPLTTSLLNAGPSKTSSFFTSLATPSLSLNRFPLGPITSTLNFSAEPYRFFTFPSASRTSPFVSMPCRPVPFSLEISSVDSDDSCNLTTWLSAIQKQVKHAQSGYTREQWLGVLDLLVFMVLSLVPRLFPRFLLCRLLLLDLFRLFRLLWRSGSSGRSGRSGFRDSDGREIVPFFSEHCDDLTNWDLLRPSLHLLTSLQSAHCLAL